MRLRLAALGFGAWFGIVISWAGVANPDTIYAMLRLREAHLFLIMGSAIAVAWPLTRLLRIRGARCTVDGTPVTWKTLRPTREHVGGGVVFGIGWAIANSCPGPTAAMIGQGRLAGIFTVLGLLAGVAVRDAIRARSTATVAAPTTAASSEVVEPAAIGL